MVVGKCRYPDNANKYTVITENIFYFHTFSSQNLDFVPLLAFLNNNGNSPLMCFWMFTGLKKKKRQFNYRKSPYTE